MSNTIKIKEFKNILTEEFENAFAMAGVNKNLKKTGEQSKEHHKEVTKKLKKFTTTDGNEKFRVPKRNVGYEIDEDRPEEIDYVNTFRGYDNADLNYDMEPSKKFKKRAKEDTGEEKAKIAKMRKKAKDEMPMYIKDKQPITDKDKTHKNHIAYESEIKPSARLKFKKEINDHDHALSLIPESYQVNGKVFEMTDGNKEYLVRWEGNNEGNGVILKYRNESVIKEEKEKINKLMGYKSSENLTKMNNKLNEDRIFNDLFKKLK